MFAFRSKTLLRYSWKEILSPRKSFKRVDLTRVLLYRPLSLANSLLHPVVSTDSFFTFLSLFPGTYKR